MQNDPLKSATYEKQIWDLYRLISEHKEDYY